METTKRSADQSYPWAKRNIETGEWAGWSQYVGDPFEVHAGPIYHRRHRDGRVACAMLTEAVHLNGAGFMHGGAIMTFADFVLFAIAQDALAGSQAVTAKFNREFVGAVPLGAIIECTGEVVRNARSMMFMCGSMTGGEPTMSFSATLKKVRPAKS